MMFFLSSAFDETYSQVTDSDWLHDTRNNDIKKMSRHLIELNSARHRIESQSRKNEYQIVHKQSDFQ
jgi:hypothetical protein